MPKIIKNKFYQLIGVLSAVAAGYILLIVGSYNAGDPSLNLATTLPVENFGGESGAVLSDVILQVFGLGFVLFVAALLSWGWRLFYEAEKIKYIIIRLVSLFVSVMTLCLLLSHLSPSVEWPINSGYGGAMGIMLRNLTYDLINNYLLVTIAAVVLLLTVPIALGLKKSEWGRLFGVFSYLYGLGKNVVQLILSALKGGGDINFKGGRKEKIKLSDLKNKEDNVSLIDRIKINNNKDKKQVQDLYENPSYKAEAAKKTVSRTAVSSNKKQASLALRARFGDYEMPSHKLLKKPAIINKKDKLSDSSLKRNAKLLESVLEDFGVHGQITNIRPGPVVTLYELEPAAGTKSSRVIGLADDIARSMSAISARISVIAGRNALGIELPNQTRETVYLRELLESEEFANTKAGLPLAMGKDIGGDTVIADLAQMPHVLVAGTTGSGKSVAINTMIASLLYHHTPEQCKFIMIDPKMLELSVYDGIPHLLTQVVTDPSKAVVALKWAVREMENRYRLMANLGVRNIDNYNKRLKEARKNGEVLTRNVQTGFDPETGKPIFEEQAIETDSLPFIVVIVDEMADLMLVAGKDIEGSIQRLAQMARAAGIHLVMATQRPSVDVITGVIKANFPTRISFQVTSKIDSRTILGEMGAEQLLGRGDMLYMAGGGRLTRVHGPFISDTEVEELVNYLKTQGEPDYIESVTVDVEGDDAGFDDADESDADRELYDKAVAIVARDRKASTSYIQRGLRIGYNRAARLIEKMEREGVVSAANHVGKREVLLPEEA